MAHFKRGLPAAQDATSAPWWAAELFAGTNLMMRVVKLLQSIGRPLDPDRAPWPSLPGFT